MTEAERRLQETDEVFAALAHASRRQILMVIWFRGGEISSGDIAKRFHHAWPTISRHLRILEDAGLVIHVKVGRARLYRLNSQKLNAAKGWLSWFEPKKTEMKKEIKNHKKGKRNGHRTEREIDQV